VEKHFSRAELAEKLALLLEKMGREND